MNSENAFWEYWHRNAVDGDEFSATLALASLASSVADGSLTSQQRLFLADALRAIASAPPGPKRLAVTKNKLLLGRRPGKTPEYLARRRRFELASDIWDEVGEATGRELRDALRLIGQRHGIANLRFLKRCYLEFLPGFVEQRDCGRQRNQVVNTNSQSFEFNPSAHYI